MPPNKDSNVTKDTAAEEDPETMAHYMTFSYHNKLPFKGIVPKERGHFKARWSILIDPYACGERCVHHAIQNAVIKEILRLTHVRCPKGLRWFPTGTNVAAIYQGAPVGAPIRRLVVDMQTPEGVHSRGEVYSRAATPFYDLNTVWAVIIEH